MDKFLIKIKPISKVWVPFVTAAGAAIVKVLITGELSQEEAKALGGVAFAAVLGWAVPSGPVQHTHDSDVTVDREVAARAKLKAMNAGNPAQFE